MNNKTGNLQTLRRCACLAFIVASGHALALSTAHAELLFSDSFDYPIGALDGNGPPPGSPPGQGGWLTLAPDPQVTSPGLSFPGIQSAGNAVTLSDPPNNSGAAAELTPQGVGGSGIVWIGFLLQPQMFFLGGFATLTFNDGFGPTAPQFGFLFASQRYGIDNSIVPRVDDFTHVFAKSFITVWLVVKLDFNTGRQSLFVNPSKGSEPPDRRSQAHLPMTPEFQASGFDRIVLKEGYSSGSYSFDEIRVGTTFADLTP